VKNIVNAPLAVVVIVVFTTSEAFAQAAPPLQLSTSFSVGPISVELRMPKPVAQPTGGVMGNIFIEARNETETPPFNATLTALGTAVDTPTLLGGFIPATVVVKRDLIAGLSFQDAVADAQSKTGITIVSFQDASMVEYALFLVPILLLGVGAFKKLSQSNSTSAELSTIGDQLAATLAAIGESGPILVQ
jgi:hypothetical protein